MVGSPAAWQFVRGVRGASDFEAARSYEFALEQASSRARNVELSARSAPAAEDDLSAEQGAT
jgi:hypothetical protein